MKIGVGFAASQPAPRIVEAAQVAERLGFDIFWITDSHLIGREVFTMLGALALSTDRIELGPGVSHLAGRHPSVIASSMATLSELAPGRIRLGIGVGDSGSNNLGLPRASMRELENAVVGIRALLNGLEMHDRAELKLTYAPAAEAVPIYIAAAGERMQHLAGRIADGALLSVSPQELPTAVQAVRDGERGSNRAAPVRILLWTTVAVDDDPAVARAAVRGAVARRGMNTLGRRKGLPEHDRRAVQQLQRVYDTQRHSTTAANDLAQLVPEDWIDRFAVAGSPDTVRGRIEQAHRDGADEFSMILLGSRPGDRGSPELLARFAETVLSPLRALA
jgi:5,10-methylenetetrahydromethanopterin reductase